MKSLPIADTLSALCAVGLYTQVRRRVDEVRLMRALRARLGNVAPGPLGLAPRALELLASEYEFENLAARLPLRGDSVRLRELAWLGSALIDPAISPHSDEREVVLREAALFNLAIALFDTLIDDGPPADASAVIEALRPERLLRRIDDPSPAASLLAGSPLRWQAVIRLFDDAFASIAARYRDRPAPRGRLKDMVLRMYASEIEPHADRWAAKALPVAFYGVLPDGGERPDVAITYCRLGRFIALLDDWKDLADDLAAARANLWVCSRDGHGQRQMEYLARASASTLRFALRPSRVSVTLGDEIEALLASVVNADGVKLAACLALVLDGVDT